MLKSSGCVFALWNWRCFIFSLSIPVYISVFCAFALIFIPSPASFRYASCISHRQRNTHTYTHRKTCVNFHEYLPFAMATNTLMYAHMWCMYNIYITLSYTKVDIPVRYIHLYRYIYLYSDILQRVHIFIYILLVLATPRAVRTTTTPTTIYTKTGSQKFE